MNTKLRKIRSHIFRGKKYLVKVASLPPDRDGECQGPEVIDKTIIIRPTLEGKRLLSVVLDECIHACCFDLDNDAVGEMSESISEFLWRAGYRMEGEE